MSNYDFAMNIWNGTKLILLKTQKADIINALVVKSEFKFAQNKKS